VKFFRIRTIASSIRVIGENSSGKAIDGRYFFIAAVIVFVFADIAFLNFSNEPSTPSRYPRDICAPRRLAKVPPLFRRYLSLSQARSPRFPIILSSRSAWSARWKLCSCEIMRGMWRHIVRTVHRRSCCSRSPYFRHTPRQRSVCIFARSRVIVRRFSHAQQLAITPDIAHIGDKGISEFISEEVYFFNVN